MQVMEEKDTLVVVWERLRMKTGFYSTPVGISGVHPVAPLILEVQDMNLSLWTLMTTTDGITWRGLLVLPIFSLWGPRHTTALPSTIHPPCQQPTGMSGTSTKWTSSRTPTRGCLWEESSQWQEFQNLHPMLKIAINDILHYHNFKVFYYWLTDWLYLTQSWWLFLPYFTYDLTCSAVVVLNSCLSKEHGRGLLSFEAIIEILL